VYFARAFLHNVRFFCTRYGHFAPNTAIFVRNSVIVLAQVARLFWQDAAWGEWLAAT
jgi:hypothetical protein